MAHHDGRFGTATARIKVTKIEPLGLDVPNVCRLCRRPACVAACPTGALYRDEALGVVRVKAEKCIGCLACADECPFGMVMLHPETELPLICDLCDGDPACVKRCPTSAIIYAEESTIACEKRACAAIFDRRRAYLEPVGGFLTKAKGARWGHLRPSWAQRSTAGQSLNKGAAQ